LTDFQQSSKVIVEEEEPRIRSIPAAATAVAGAVGIAERGPIGTAVLCTSFEEYQQSFGGFTANSDLALGAMGLFQNGGSQLWVVRTAHYTDPSDTTSCTAKRGSSVLTSPGAPGPARVTSTALTPLALADGAAIVVSIGGAADQTATIHATPAMIAGTAAGPFVLADLQTLQVQVGRSAVQTLVFHAASFTSIAAATDLETAEEINAQLAGGKALVVGGKLALAADAAGTASTIAVVGGTAAAALGFAAGSAAGTGNVGDVGAVTAAELTALLAVAIPGLVLETGGAGAWGLATVAAGAAVTLQVRPGTAAAFGLDQVLHAGVASAATPAWRADARDPGAYANRVSLELRAAASGTAGLVDLSVLQDGVRRESFLDLSADPKSARYALSLVNDARAGSWFVRLADLGLAGSPAPSPQTVPLTGGDDGLAGLADQDFIGAAGAKTGLFALDQVQDLSLLLVPGRATPAVQHAMLDYCERERAGAAFAVLDPPEAASAADIVKYVVVTADLLNASEYGAIYWPRVLVLNPSKTVFGSVDTVVVPPSGIVCGVCARNDGARPGGIYDPPAGIERGKMLGVVGFETGEVLEEKKRDLVYPKRINPLTTGPGLPRFIDGSRTLKGDGNFPYVAERRGTIFIERSLKQGLQFARHRNNTEALRAMVRRTVTAFLLVQMRNGAFRSMNPKLAFMVDCSDALNPASVIFAGQLILRVGLATNKPAEFIILRISADTQALDQEQASRSVGAGG
jgi:hypothetical protein